MTVPRSLRSLLCLSLLTLLAIASPRAQATKDDAPLPPHVRALASLEWRNIGPANMSGRVSDVEGVPGQPHIVYVGSASGGVWKTVNAGTTWTPIFERQGTQSIGDLALEPGNPDVIWVGTGESNVRNSVGFGDGVYKSTDGGQTWQHMGLRETDTISRVIVHPRNPDIVYVAAVGRTFGPNPERGVFMTTDGGRTWTKTLYIDDRHGASDLDIDPINPNVLYAGMWHFERKPWTHSSGSDDGGVFRSIDGGRTWKKLAQGLPKTLGRIGVRVAPSNPQVVYAIVEAKEGTLYRSDDRGETFRQVHKDREIVSRGFYYTTVIVDPKDENRVYAAASLLFVSVDGGRTFRRISPRTHVDFHALWIDPEQPRRMWQGQDGGVAVSFDGGDTWDVKANLPLAQFYQVFADNREPFYYLSGGLQDNGTWAGPARTREPAGVMNDDWRMISFGDGFFAIAHPDDPDLYLSESQGGNVVRTNARTREQMVIKPHFGPGGAAEHNAFRFNWNAPLVPSPHDKDTVYLAGNVVFVSHDFGLSWKAISGDLTTGDPERLKGAGGPVYTENTSAEYFATIISLAESPIDRGHIWVGSDDGRLHVTRDGGATWTDVSKNVPGIRADSSISHVEPSAANAATVYVAYDRHKFDDYRPYVFKSVDGGRRFTNIAGDLPATAYVHVLREDPRTPDLLYAGTEIGLFATRDGGRTWFSLGLANLPHVAVHDIVVHPRENDLIVATHGRGLWVLDDATPVQRLDAGLAGADAHLFDIRPALRHASTFTRYGVGDGLFLGPNPPAGALIHYYLREEPDEKTPVTIVVTDAGGRAVAELKHVPKKAGLNRAAWNLSHESARQRRPPSPQQVEFMGGPRGPQVLPGSYTVTLKVGDRVALDRTMEVRVDPLVQVTRAELETQHALLMELREMQSGANDALRFFDSVKGQVEHIEKTVTERAGAVPADLKKALDDYKARAGELSSALASDAERDGIGAQGRLADMLGTLTYAIGRPNAGPTAAQREAVERLRAEYAARMPEVRRFMTADTLAMNERLRANGAPSIMPGPADAKTTSLGM
jgi:photosystem II stability/assembly factor-like uncharacterized protein